MLLTFWVITLIWAIVATVILIRNPFPVPDRGHRTFGVAGVHAQEVALKILADNGQPMRFRFKTGPTVQSLLWDGETVIHLVDDEIFLSTGLSGNGISIPVSDPGHAAARAIEQFEGAGFEAELVGGWNDSLPPNSLVIVRSSALREWVFVFRRHILRLPKPQRIS